MRPLIKVTVTTFIALVAVLAYFGYAGHESKSNKWGYVSDCNRVLQIENEGLRPGKDKEMHAALVAAAAKSSEQTANEALW